MIIYNSREIPSKYLKKDEIIIEINSQHTLEKIAEMIRSGEDISSEVVLNAYKVGSGEVIPKEQEPDNYKVKIINQYEYDAAMESKQIYRRPELFDEFEKFQFNRGTLQFERYDISNEVLLKELMASIGIFPTLWNDERPIGELKKMSVNADKKYLGDIIHSGLPFDDGEENIYIPSKEDIELYNKLNDYERRIVNEAPSYFSSAMNIVRKLKENDESRVVVKGDLNNTYTRADRYVENRKHPLKAWFAEKVNNNTAEGHANSILTRADNIFKAKFRGRSPRVLEEYLYAQCLAKKFDIMHLTDEQIEKIADGFDMKNVSKIAKYKSPALFAFADKLNYNEMKDDQIQAIGILVPAYLIYTLADKEFAEWINANKNVNVSELSNLIEQAHIIEGKFNPRQDVAIMLLSKELKLGDEHRKNFERKYHYKLSNNEIAIRGRHVEAKQGNMHMYMLAPDDIRNFTVAYSERDEGVNNTNCCQMWGNAGETCVWKYTTDPFAACVVIENTKDHSIMAQGFVWTDEEKDCLVFDNIEFQNDRDVSKFYSIISAWCEAMPYQNIQMGMGYNTLGNGVGKAMTIKASMPTTLSNNRVYSDYKPDGGNKPRDLKTRGVVSLLLSDVFIHPKYRGNGYAVQMITEAIKLKQEMESTKEHIFCQPISSDLEYLYGKCGFESIGNGNMVINNAKSLEEFLIENDNR